MGINKNIGFGVYPKQGDYLDARVNVIYNYDTTIKESGTIIRDDIEEPFRTVIKLDDGRILLGSECQFSLV